MRIDNKTKQLIRELYLEGYTTGEIANKLRISEFIIVRIVRPGE